MPAQPALTEKHNRVRLRLAHQETFRQGQVRNGSDKVRTGAAAAQPAPRPTMFPLLPPNHATLLFYLGYLFGWNAKR